MNPIQSLCILFLVSLSFVLQAQYEPATGLQKTTKEVAAYTLPAVDNEALNAAEMSRPAKGRPINFAKPFEVSITPHTAGSWETLPNGTAVWRLRIESDNALSLNFGFTQYEMPPGGKLFIYTVDKEKVMGPFTPADNEEHNQLWTPIIPSDQCVIEVSLPRDQKENLDLEIGYINHGFLDVSNIHRSGSCNVDVVCGINDGLPQIEEHRDIIRSAAMYSLNGTQTCSGALITNTRQDCTPYFLGAAHCGISENNAATMVVYWNYENSYCRPPNSPESGADGDGSLNQFNTGAVSRASYGPSDMYLVELDDPILETANAYIAGWSREAVAPTSAIAIHHPNLEEKRISLEDDPCDITDYSDDQSNIDGSHIRVIDWDLGTTEGGSSGSPLFDQNERIVGQLTGGGAACGNDLSDWYGRMSVGWEGGGAANSRLKDWLDPNNTGLMFMDGMEAESCNYTAIPSSLELSVCAATDAIYLLEVSDNFTNPVNLSVTGLPATAVVGFSENPASPGTTVTLTINTDNVTAGDYFFNILADDGVNNGITYPLLSVFDNIPMTPNLTSPADAATEVSPVLIFQWQAEANATSYQIEVATDASFSNIIINEITDEPFWLVGSALEIETNYFWRVSANNICGESVASTTNSFTTGILDCFSNINETSVVIDDFFPSVNDSPIEVNIDGIVNDVNVLNIQGTHSYLEDLNIILISPEGTVVSLVSEQCEEDGNFFISFDDNASSADLPCPFIDGNTYQPQGQLSDFVGENAEGIWTLRVEDVVFEDGGSLDTWTLELCVGGDAVSNTFIAEEGFTLFPNPSTGTLMIELPNTENATAEILSIDGRQVATFDIVGGQHTAELAQLPKGIYLVQVQTQSVTYTKKWILE